MKSVPAANCHCWLGAIRAEPLVRRELKGPALNRIIAVIPRGRVGRLPCRASGARTCAIPFAPGRCRAGCANASWKPGHLGVPGHWWKIPVITRGGLPPISGENSSIDAQVENAARRKRLPPLLGDETQRTVRLDASSAIHEWPPLSAAAIFALGPARTGIDPLRALRLPCRRRPSRWPPSHPHGPA